MIGNSGINALAEGALADLDAVFAAMPADALDGLIEEIVKARRIVVFGLGREGLQMRGFAMRLFHMGRNVAVWGDMTTPEVCPGDLLSSPPAPAISRPRARSRESRVGQGRARLLVTAQPHGEPERHVDVVTVIPAQTMATIIGPGSPCCRWARCSRPRR